MGHSGRESDRIHDAIQWHRFLLTRSRKSVCLPAVDMRSRRDKACHLAAVTLNMTIGNVFPAGLV